MALVPNCSCCAYATLQQFVRTRMNDYESIMSKSRAAERKMEKTQIQIDNVEKDLRRKIMTASKSYMIMADRKKDLVDLTLEFRDLEAEYVDMQGHLGCPCCRAGPDAKVAAVEMMEAADSLRNGFTEGPNLSLAPHSVISARRKIFEEKADDACELKEHSVRRLLIATEEANLFLCSYQRLQEQFNDLVGPHVQTLLLTNWKMESVSMHNALLLLGEETLSGAAQRGQKGGKIPKAAKTGNKGRKPAAPKKGAEQKHGGTAKDQLFITAATRDSDEEGSGDEDAAVESAVSHSNPFAALDGEDDGRAAKPAAGLASSNSSSQHSTSTSADVEQRMNGSPGGASHFKSCRHRHEHAEPDLPEQRQAILARFRRSSAGAVELANGSSHGTLQRPNSNGCAANGQPSSGPAVSVELGSAEQLRARLGGGLLASELVGHLCCPITAARP